MFFTLCLSLSLSLFFRLDRCNDTLTHTSLGKRMRGSRAQAKCGTLAAAVRAPHVADSRSRKRRAPTQQAKRKQGTVQRDSVCSSHSTPNIVSLLLYSLSPSQCLSVFPILAVEHSLTLSDCVRASRSAREWHVRQRDLPLLPADGRSFTSSSRSRSSYSADV